MCITILIFWIESSRESHPPTFRARNPCSEFTMLLPQLSGIFFFSAIYLRTGIPLMDYCSALFGYFY